MLNGVFDEFVADEVVREKWGLSGRLEVARKKFPPIQVADILAEDVPLTVELW